MFGKWVARCKMQHFDSELLSSPDINESVKENGIMFIKSRLFRSDTLSKVHTLTKIMPDSS